MAKDADIDAYSAKKKSAAKGKGAKAEAAETEFYSRNPEFLGQAFSLFCKGMSLPRVADAMGPEWPGVSVRTLQRLAKDNGWEKSRASYLKMYADAAASAEGLVPEIVLQLQKIRSALEARGLLDVKDIYAYRQLAEDLMWYTGKHPKLKDSTPLAVSTDVEVQALLEAIAEDDIVAAAWKRRRPHIEKAWREKLAAKETTQRRSAKGAKSKG